MKKRIVCLTLAILMCGSQVVSVMADRESDLREEQAWTSQQLDATYARMSAPVSYTHLTLPTILLV